LNLPNYKTSGGFKTRPYNTILGMHQRAPTFKKSTGRKPTALISHPTYEKKLFETKILPFEVICLLLLPSKSA
ncbi:MAG: hypothetical protein OWQ49_07235, partial [Aquificaceae bacterium]|nr:hypothetical protein [Aquificaceae bacterium]